MTTVRSVCIAAGVGLLACSSPHPGDRPDGQAGADAGRPTDAPGSADARPVADAAACGDRVFFDDFDYPVVRDTTNAQGEFLARGWSRAKAINTTGSHAGYLYTVDSIPSYTGAMPSTGRVLVMEALPDTLASQTDFYLQYGNPDPASPPDVIPANVWFQFWLFIAHTNEQPSGWDEGKFIYACRDFYPCNGTDYLWLTSLGNLSGPTSWTELPPADGAVFVRTSVNTATAQVSIAGEPPENQWKMGQTRPDQPLVPNRWTLMRFHYDTSRVSGVYEVWARPLGGDWVKISEWIDGVTPGFTWRIAPEQLGGHRSIRIPTTVGRQQPPHYDSWLYMDDFAMATCAEALPQY